MNVSHRQISFQVGLLLVFCLQFLLFSTSSTIGPGGDSTFAQKSLIGCCPRKSHLGKVFHLIRSANLKNIFITKQRLQGCRSRRFHSLLRISIAFAYLEKYHIVLEISTATKCCSVVDDPHARDDLMQVYGCRSGFKTQKCKVTKVSNYQAQISSPDRYLRFLN